MTARERITRIARRVAIVRIAAARFRRARGSAASRARDETVVASLRPVTLPGPVSDALPAVFLPPGVNAAHAAMHAPFIAAIAEAEARPVAVLLGHGSGAEAAFRAIGVRDFVRFDAHDYRGSPRSARMLVQHVRSQDELLRVDWEGIPVGRYAASSMLRATRRGRVDMTDPDEVARVVALLTRVVDAAIAARRIASAYAPASAIFVDKGYSPEGPLFDACLDAGADVVTANLSHRPDALLLKRYAADGRRIHPASLSDASWQRLGSLRGDPRVWPTARAEIVRCYDSGAWYAEVGTQSRARPATPADLREELRLPGDRPVAVVFPHIFWDATFFWGDDLYDDYESWFTATLRHAFRDDRFTWIVKVHPANTAKNVRDNVAAEPSELMALRALGPIPSHVRVLPADSRISTLALLRVADVCFTVRGTVGIEAAALGIPVLTCGTGRYDQLGFTRDHASREDYERALLALDEVQPMSASEIELARLFAFGTFVARPLQLRGIVPTFAPDLAATLDVEVKASSWQEFRSGTDVRQLSLWLRERDEDYLDVGDLGY